MKRFLAGFTLCLALVSFIAWLYNQKEESISQNAAWYAHNDQTFKMNADIEVLNQRVYAECKAIEDFASSLDAPDEALFRNFLAQDTQCAKHVCGLFAYLTFDVDLLTKLQGYKRQELGFNLIGAGFNADGLIRDVNTQNDMLIRLSGERLQTLMPLLLSLRKDMDEAHALTSRMKCETKPSEPIHL